MTLRIGNYIILAPIAKGGMAVVYRAVHEPTGKEVALKLLAPSLAADQEYILRFLREAKTLLDLNHPNIVRIHEANAADGYYFISMELLGETLAETLRKLRLERRLMAQAKALLITRQIAQALDYAHASGLVHRDVKPSNVLQAVGDGGRYVLSDFGVVKSSTATRLTHTDVAIGTPAYMSPEQITTPGRIDKRSDLYSLGVVLYEMLTGTAPYEDGTPVTSMYKIVHEELPPLSQFRGDLTHATLAVLRRLLDKKPEARFQTGAEAVAAIDAALSVKAERSRGLQLVLAGSGFFILLAGFALVGSQAQSGGGDPTQVVKPTVPLLMLPTRRTTVIPAVLIGGGLTATIAPTPRTTDGGPGYVGDVTPKPVVVLDPLKPTATLAPELPTPTPLPTRPPATPTPLATPTPPPAQATATPSDGGGGGTQPGPAPTNPPAQPTATNASAATRPPATSPPATIPPATSPPPTSPPPMPTKPPP